MTLVETLGLIGNPFEHYTAETEPKLADYAVRPPYLQAISDRVRGLSSFILFGDRGAGKSATRITVYAEIWGAVESNDFKRPLVVNLTDYSSIQEKIRKDRLQDRDIVLIVAFNVVEQILVWLASLEDVDRNIYIEGLDQDERTLSLALIKGFYLTVPEGDRQVSTNEALRLLSSAWTTKSAIWVSRRWDALAKIIASAADALTKKEIDPSIDISGAAEALLKSLTGEGANAPRAILTRLVELATAFGFSGVSVLVDKVDETPATSNSAEATARLVHPLLAHVQLLEVPGFSWVLFLWSNVKDHFSGKYAVRLDKIANANITWNLENLRAMIDARMGFYSEGKLSFKDILQDGVDPDTTFNELVRLSINSPRELIRLLDTIVREHDARGDEAAALLDQEFIRHRAGQICC